MLAQPSNLPTSNQPTDPTCAARLQPTNSQPPASTNHAIAQKEEMEEAGRNHAGGPHGLTCRLRPQVESGLDLPGAVASLKTKVLEKVALHGEDVHGDLHAKQQVRVTAGWPNECRTQQNSKSIQSLPQVDAKFSTNVET
jgi:hypothetical protein